MLPFSSNSSKCITSCLESVSLDNWIFFSSNNWRGEELRVILMESPCLGTWFCTEFGKVAQGLSKGTFGSIAGGKDVGGSLKYYRNPNAADIKKFKTAMENFNVGLLKSKTVENILELDKEYSQVYRDGNLPLIEDVVKKTLQTSIDYGWNKTKTVDELRKFTGMTVREARSVVKSELESVRRWEDEEKE